VTRAEDLVRSTTRAIASTVGDVPPLRLEQAPGPLRSPARRQRHSASRWWLGFAPVAAAVAVVLLAVGLVLVKPVQNATTTATATPTHVVVPDDVPEYYAWTQAGRVLVGNLVTGATVVSFEPPSGVYLTAVYGTTDDDRTFVVTGDRARGTGAGTQWYLLRIHPGGTPQAQLTPLPLPVRQAPAGVAISPDGTMLAVALSGSPAVLRVYSMATGALLHAWSAPAGQFAAAKAQSGSVPGAAMALRWSPDSQHVAYAWNATAIDIVGVTTPDGSLLPISATMAKIGTTRTAFPSQYTAAGTAVTCDAAHGWDVVQGAQGWAVACAATWLPTPAPGQSSADLCRSGHTITFGIGMQSAYQVNGSENLQLAQQPMATECSGQGRPQDGAYIAWTNAGGTVIIGSLVLNGHSRFGIFTDGNPGLTPLPPPPGNPAW